jgi:benzoyl-CoA reductase subunit C
MNDDIGVLAEFEKFINPFTDNEAVLDWKNSGKKVIAFECTYVPEEIIYAAGALPIRLVGDTQTTKYDEANAYMYQNTCSFIRNCLQLVLKKQYNFLDGFVAGSTCDCSRRLADVWEHYRFTPFIHTIGVPRKISPTAYELYEIELRNLMDKLAEFTGKPITTESLQESIQIYNQRREYIKALYKMTRLENPSIAGSELLTILNASVSMPPKQFNNLAEKLVRQISSSDRKMEGKFRIMVAGSPLNSPDFIKTIEKMGGLVVIDELCTGVRYWWEGVEPGIDPIKAISHRYLHNFACPRMEPSDDRFQRILRLVRDFRVEAVITQIVPYCVPQTMEQPMVRQMLEEQNVPVLELDMEYGAVNTGQVSTRLQAFFEMLRGRTTK